MNNEDWLDRLQIVIVRHPYIGLHTNEASFSLIELWGIYCYLTQLAEG